jgi:hypothetical protein
MATPWSAGRTLAYDNRTPGDRTATPGQRTLVA